MRGVYTRSALHGEVWVGSSVCGLFAFDWVRPGVRENERETVGEREGGVGGREGQGDTIRRECMYVWESLSASDWVWPWMEEMWERETEKENWMGRETGGRERGGGETYLCVWLKLARGEKQYIRERERERKRTCDMRGVYTGSALYHV